MLRHARGGGCICICSSISSGAYVNVHVCCSMGITGLDRILRVVSAIIIWRSDAAAAGVGGRECRSERNCSWVVAAPKIHGCRCRRTVTFHEAVVTMASPCDRPEIPRLANRDDD